MMIKKNKMVLKSIEFTDYLSVRLHITCPNSCWKPHFGQWRRNWRPDAWDKPVHEAQAAFRWHFSIQFPFPLTSIWQLRIRNFMLVLYPLKLSTKLNGGRKTTFQKLHGNLELAESGTDNENESMKVTTWRHLVKDALVSAGQRGTLSQDP